MPVALRYFCLYWSANYFLFCALCLPVYLVARRAARGVLSGALSFWVCMVAATFLYELYGVDLDLALGGYLVFGWLVGVMYCLPTLVVISAWRAWRPNPHGYCPRCNRAIKADRAHCPVGHVLSDRSRGFEVKR